MTHEQAQTKGYFLYVLAQDGGTSGSTLFVIVQMIRMRNLLGRGNDRADAVEQLRF